MRPALVWGCTRYPSRSRATISERTVAEETSTPGALATWEEPTGSADPMYSVTTASRMEAWRWFSSRASPSGASGATWSAMGVMGLALKSTECQPVFLGHLPGGRWGPVGLGGIFDLGESQVSRLRARISRRRAAVSRQRVAEPR